MFKIVLLLLFALLLSIVGYPVRSVAVSSAPFTQSQRCYTVGQISEFLTCLKNNPRIWGAEIVVAVFTFLTIVDTRIPVVLFIIVCLHVYLLFRLEEYLRE